MPTKHRELPLVMPQLPVEGLASALLSDAAPLGAGPLRRRPPRLDGSLGPQGGVGGERAWFRGGRLVEICLCVCVCVCVIWG